MKCQCKMNEVLICLQYQEEWEIEEKTLPSFSILQTGSTNTRCFLLNT